MKLELVNEPVRTTQTAVFVDLEDTMITLGRKSRIFPVANSRTGEAIGYYVIGDIYLGSDTIVETEKGAVGEAIEKLANNAFIQTGKADFTNTKSDFMSEKDFRKVEIEAYRFFEKMHESQKDKNKNLVFSKRHYRWGNDMQNLEFYVYLFHPEECILIKDKGSIIVIASTEKNIVVCDKKKNSYVQVSKGDVNVINMNGGTVSTSPKGVIVNGRNLKEIISSALEPLSDMFKNKF
jgi:hypothetical protein